jgi:hypothetical protein
VLANYPAQRLAERYNERRNVIETSLNTSYTDVPAAVDLLRPRSLHGSLKLAGRPRQGELMPRITPPGNGVRSNFQPSSVGPITSGWSRPPSSAAQPPIRYADLGCPTGSE